ncbi:MAG: DNA polymerase III subunit gamma/tau [Alphaproteobacteria bacterium]|nr:DNA polymerase III subunit gamma/tau [Alphaproteobacteria bacterium]
MSELFQEKTEKKPYLVLARKYRPMAFSQLIGQEAMVRTLTNAIEKGRIPSAWILTGVRGVGKTTTARIIARALNCVGKDGKSSETITPCGECPSCKSILSDSNVDVMEMDAASRTRVDDIREDIIKEVSYAPVSSRYKIYILDEVHMLSSNAFNALLKTLEEPPPHTKFIFATTEIRKVPVTILSRCQRFDLKRVSSDELFSHFVKIAAEEGITAEEEAVRLIAKAADGSVRDGLSLLDQAISKGNGAVYSADVQEMLGLIDKAKTVDLCLQIFRGQTIEMLSGLEQLFLSATEPVQVLKDLCDFVHVLTRGQVIKDFADSSMVTEYERTLLTELKDIKISALARAWQILLKGISEVQYAPDPVKALEMVLIRLVHAADLPVPMELVKKVKEVMANSEIAVNRTVEQKPVIFSESAIEGKKKSIENKSPAEQVDVKDELIDISGMNYKQIVNLFDVKHEAELFSILYDNVHFVKMDSSNAVLDLRIEGEVPKDFCGRVCACLNKWTGKKWTINTSLTEGESSLKEIEAMNKKALRERALANPIVDAVIKTFPGAEILELRKSVFPFAGEGVAAAEQSEAAAGAVVEGSDE